MNWRVAGDDLAAYLWFDQKYYLPDDILTKVGPHEHGALRRSAAAVSRSPHRGVCRFPARASFKIRGSRQKVILKELMQGQAAALDLAAQEGRIRYSRARMAARPAAAACSWTRSRAEPPNTPELFRRSGDRSLRTPAPRAARQSRLSPVGVDDSVPLDEEMANSDDAGSRTAPAAESTFYLYLAVLLFAGAVYLGCIVSPPSLMDDVDAVQAQIARNMLTSGDWVTARLDGVPYLEKAPLIYWAIAVSYKIFGVHDWAARIPVALSAIALCLADRRLRRLGFWEARRLLRRLMHVHLRRPVSVHAHPDSRRDADATIALAMWAFLRALDEEEPHPRLWAFVLAASLGRGLLLKSLIGVVFPAARP